MEWMIIKNIWPISCPSCHPAGSRQLSAFRLLRWEACSDATALPTSVPPVSPNLSCPRPTPAPAQHAIMEKPGGTERSFGVIICQINKRACRAIPRKGGPRDLHLEITVSDLISVKLTLNLYALRICIWFTFFS